MISISLEEGMWTAHAPSVPGAYGLGPSSDAAEADLREALELLAEHLEEAGDAAALLARVREALSR